MKQLRLFIATTIIALCCSLTIMAEGDGPSHTPGLPQQELSAGCDGPSHTPGIDCSAPGAEDEGTVDIYTTILLAVLGF